MQAPTSNRQGSRKNSFALSKFHRRGEHCSPAFAVSAHLKISPHRCGPAMQAPTSKRQDYRKNSIALSKFHRRGGAWLRPPLPYQQTPKYPPHPEQACHAGPYKQKIQACVKNSIAISQFHRRGGAWLRPPLPHLPPPKITPTPRGTPLPAPPKPPFCRKNENSLKNLPHAVNKLTLVSVTFHPRAFIINLSKHCLPRVQNGAAAWF